MPTPQGAFWPSIFRTGCATRTFATCLVKRYLAPDSATGRARYSGAYFERLGGGGDRPEVAYQFTAEDLLAVTMLRVRSTDTTPCTCSTTRPASSATCSPRSRWAPPWQDPQAEVLIAKDGPAWKLWQAIRDIKPRPEDRRIGAVAAGKLLARKRPHLLPVYDSRVKKILKRPRTDNSWWHDLRCQLINDPDLIRQLQSVRAQGRRQPHVPAPRLRRDVLDVQMGRRSPRMQPRNA